MKRLSIIIACLATMALTACSSLSSATSGNTVANASGQACGTAVQGLYSSYSKTGTIDLTNTTNLNNALTLATAYTNLKQNKDSQDYRKSFTNGLIASSAGLVTQATASGFVDTLLASTGLSNINTQNISQTATAVATIITLLNALKQ